MSQLKARLRGCYKNPLIQISSDAVYDTSHNSPKVSAISSSSASAFIACQYQSFATSLPTFRSNSRGKLFHHFHNTGTQMLPRRIRLILSPFIRFANPILTEPPYTLVIRICAVSKYA